VKPELEKLARHRLGRAKEAFLEGEHLLTKSALMGAVNRFTTPLSMRLGPFWRCANWTHLDIAA
jgi:hypothetical protein